MEYKNERFILSHVFFLVSLFSVYFIAGLALISQDLHLPPMTRFMRFYMIAIFTVMFTCYYLFISRARQVDFAFAKEGNVSFYLLAGTVSIYILLCFFPALM